MIYKDEYASMDEEDLAIQRIHTVWRRGDAPQEDETMQMSDIEIGMYVAAGRGADKDVGRVLEIDAEKGLVLVGWSAGVSDWVEPGELRPSAISPMQWANS